ncbi:translation initiation factor IF-6 [Candidatus Micrarchaeota archaeon]|nr:translation initiation factor IF-6 [Candidatus Micrarchaeota archaeon]
MKSSIQRNPFIGLFMRTNDSVSLVPKQFSAKNLAQVESVFETRVVELFISQSPLIGILTALNNNGVVLPAFAEEEEKRLLKKEGLNVCVLFTPFAPGNLILASDKGILASPLLSKKQIVEVRDCLGAEVFQQSVAGINTVGSSSVATNNGVLAFNRASAVELKFLEKVFKTHALNSSCNMGVEFNSLGVVANSRGALVGELTSGFETQRIYEALSGD